MMLLFCRGGLRIVVHTANLIVPQWEHTTNGAWVSPLLRRKRAEVHKVDHFTVPPRKGKGFEHDFLRYLETYARPGKKGAPMLETFQKVAAHDLSVIQDVSFVASVPNTYLKDEGTMDSFGHLALQARLTESSVRTPSTSPRVYTASHCTLAVPYTRAPLLSLKLAFSRSELHMWCVFFFSPFFFDVTIVDV